MTEKPTPSIIDHFSSIEDPRVNRQKRHQLQDIFFISICAMICGADNGVSIEEFGLAKAEWFTELLGLEHGMASLRTIPLAQFMQPLTLTTLAPVFPAGLLI